jgi:hypothetical protein
VLTQASVSMTDRGVYPFGVMTSFSINLCFHQFFVLYNHEEPISTSKGAGHRRIPRPSTS